MTEIEKIINKGVVTEDFLKEEVICDFLVTTDRKKLWAVILDLVVEFDRVCKKHNLRYYLDGGSLLGAIRHNGFIPWDDDIDVVMPREDYEHFLKLDKEFRHPYFLQTPYTDPEYFYSFAKVRNSNTTALNQMFRYQNFNHGIWLSIFPLDNVSLSDEGKNAYERICQLTYDNSTYMRMRNPHLSEKDKQRVVNHPNTPPLIVYDEIQKLATHDNRIATDYWGTLILTIREYRRKALPKNCYSVLKTHKFEGLELPIPNGYDEVLTIEYGNYMELPPVEERGEWHGGTLFDPDKSYIEYLNNNDK